jgi:hypothetical protein
LGDDEEEARIVRLLVEEFGYPEVSATDEETRSIQRIRWLLSEVEEEHDVEEDADLSRYIPESGE